MKILLTLLCCLAFTFPAVSSFVFSPGVSYTTTDVQATSGMTINSESSETRIDVKMGYVLPMGLYLGGMYSSLSADNGGANQTGSLMGPTIGYYSYMGFYTLLTYHIIGETEQAPSKLTGGKGPQIDVGWVFPISAYFAIGPQITWRSIEFDKVETAAVSTDTDYKKTSISPYISLWFMF